MIPRYPRKQVDKGHINDFRSIDQGPQVEESWEEVGRVRSYFRLWGRMAGQKAVESSHHHKSVLQVVCAEVGQEFLQHRQPVFGVEVCVCVNGQLQELLCRSSSVRLMCCHLRGEGPCLDLSPKWSPVEGQVFARFQIVVLSRVECQSVSQFVHKHAAGHISVPTYLVRVRTMRRKRSAALASMPGARASE